MSKTLPGSMNNPLESFDALLERLQQMAGQGIDPDYRAEFERLVAAHPPADHEWLVLLHTAIDLFTHRKLEDVGASA